MQYPSNLSVCLSQYLYSKTALKENLHHNEGTNSQMLTQNVRFNYDAIFLDQCMREFIIVYYHETRKSINDVNT